MPAAAKLATMLAKLRKLPRYDFGGGEWPLDAERTVVDIMPKKYFRGALKNKNPYVRWDVTQPLELPEGSNINISQTLRYLGSGNKYGYLEGSEVPAKEIAGVVSNVEGNLVPGGRVRIFDHKPLVDEAVGQLKEKGYKVVRKELVNKGDADYPAEWLAILKKPKVIAGAVGVAGVAASQFGGEGEAEAMPSFKLSPEVRKAIINKFLTTPERKALYSKDVEKLIEDIATHPDTRRAYIGGSFASAKPNPSDIDLIVRHATRLGSPEYMNFWNKFEGQMPRFGWPEEKRKGVHILEAEAPTGRATVNPEKGAGGMPELRDAMKEGRRRYGPNYKWTRIAGATGAVGAGALAAEEAMAAKDNANLITPEEAIDQMEGNTAPAGEWITPEQAMSPGTNVKGRGYSDPTDLINSAFEPEVPDDKPASDVVEDIPTISPADYALMAPEDQIKLLQRKANKAELGFVADLALMAVTGGGGSILTRMAIKKLGWHLGKLALATIESMGGGAVYEAAKTAITGESPAPISELGQWAGEKFGVNLDIPEFPGQEALMWAGFPGATKLVGKGFKGAGRAADYLSKNIIPTAAQRLGASAANTVWENITIKPGTLTAKIPYAGRVAQKAKEMFQPAVERLAESETPMLRMVSSTFRKGEAMKSLSTEAGRQLGIDLQGLLPSEQYEVMKGLRGTALKDIKSDKAKQVLWRMEQKLKEADLSSIYDIKFRESLSTLLTQPIEEFEQSVGSESIMKLLKTYETALPTKYKLKDVHDMLRGIIEHPNTSEQIKQLARDLWTAPAKTTVDVADATRAAGTAYLMDKLTAYRGLVSATAKEGYVKSEWGKLKGAFIPKDVELELQTIAKVPQIARGMYQKWFLSPWKVSKTVTRPAYHVRNLMSNLILNDWGGLPFYRVDVYMDALKEMRNNGDMWKKYRQITGAGGTLVQRDLYQMEGAMKYGATMSDKLYNVYERVIQPATRFQQAEENLFKFAKYRYNIMENGMKPAEAAVDAQKWIFNFGEITPEIAQVRKYGMPFFTWYSKAIPLAAETAVKHPIRFWKWLAMGMYMQNQGLEAVGMSDDEWTSLKAKLPDYMQKGMYLMMPWRDDQGRLNMLNMTYIMPGMGDINEFYQRSPVEMVASNPLIRLSADVVSKKKFSGAPLYYDWEPAKIQASKTFAYIWEQLAPSILPGGTDWNAMYRAVTEQEGAPSPAAAVAGQFGFKLTPVDETVAARRAASIQRIHEGEMTLEMKKELRRATTQDEVNSILEKYRDIREGMKER